jgi:2-polyprenyl-3-methyl-5-hydroxy-6-metoxy-1,4-benzoquinol methylase
VLEKYQQKFGLEKVLRPKDLAIGNHLRRLGFSKARMILDFGCGNGIWLERLLAENRKASGVGVDIARGLIEEANARSGKRGRYLCSKEKWPLGESEFDFCLSFDVFEHIEDKEAALSRISKALKPGGKFLFFTLNPNNKYTHSWMLEELGSDYLYRWADHKKELFPDPRQLTALLQKEGFKKIGYQLYAGPAILTLDTFCYLYLIALEKLLSRPLLEPLLVPVISANDALVRWLTPVGNLCDRLFLFRGYSNGYFIWGER